MTNSERSVGEIFHFPKPLWMQFFWQECFKPFIPPSEIRGTHPYQKNSEGLKHSESPEPNLMAWS
jgi:hypothetical protein